VIGELLTLIKDAEARAAKIVMDAQNKATAIEQDAETQIARIKNDTIDEVARKNSRATRLNTLPAFDASSIEVTVEQAKIDEAKKFIIAEFYRRYGK